MTLIVQSVKLFGTQQKINQFTLIHFNSLCMKTKKLNRNSWSDAENQTLIATVQSESTVQRGLNKAAIKLGRSYTACTAKYYVLMKNASNSKTEKISTESFRFREIRITNDCITFIK